MAALVILWLVPLLIFALAFSSDWVSVWGALGLPAETLQFFDLRVITGGLVTLQQGGDPFVASPADPWHRIGGGQGVFNYPRIWLHLFSLLGVSNKNISIVGIVFCVIYLVCISSLIIRSKHNVDALIVLIASLSLASLFAMERGNTDLLIFSIVFLGCVATAKSLKSVAFFSATLLKIYPVAAIIVDAIRRPMKEKIVPILLLTLVGVIFFWQRRDLHAIRYATPISRTMSYGVLSLKAQADYDIRKLGYSSSHADLAGWAVAAGCWLAGALTVGIAWVTQWKLDKPVLYSQFGEMFSIFGGIYIFSFIIGSNWNYRLIFLLPTLPLAIELARGHRHRRFGIVYIASVILAENLFGFADAFPVAKELLGDLTTFVAFIVVLAILTQQFKSFLLRAAQPYPPFVTDNLCGYGCTVRRLSVWEVRFPVRCR